MEFTLGAIGGFGLSLTYCIRFEFVEKYNETIVMNGMKSLPENVEYSAALLCAVLAVGIVTVNLYSLLSEKKGKKINSFVCDLIERPLFNVIPMILVFLGSKFAAIYSTVFMLVFVLAVKCVFDRFSESKLLPLAAIILTAICSVVLAGCFYPDLCTPFNVILIGTVPYLITELICVIWKAKRSGTKISDILMKTAFITVYPFMVLQSILIIIISFKIFNI